MRASATIAFIVWLLTGGPLMAFDLTEILAPASTRAGNAPTVILDEDTMAVRTILPEGLEAVRPDPAALDDPFTPIAVYYDPTRRDEFSVEVHRIEFDAFVAAGPAALGHLFVRGFDRVIDAPGFEATFLVHEAAGGRRGPVPGEYEELVRARAFTTGRIVFVVVARADADHWERHADALKTVFEALEYRNGFDADALRVTDGGFVVPAGWDETDASSAPEASVGTRTFAIGEREYPNLGIQLRSDALENARSAAARQIAEFEATIGRTDGVDFTAPAQSEKRVDRGGATIGYTWVRPWVVSDPGLFFASSINARTVGGADARERSGARTVITTLNNPNVIAEGIMDEEAEIRDLLFRGWAMGTSAESVVTASLVDGLDVLRDMLRP